MSRATADERRIHRRLMARDPVASEELARNYLKMVIERLHRRCRGVRDEALVSESAIDALLDYAQRPAQYDPDRMGLLQFLVMAARGNLLNALEREQTILNRFTPFSVVEDDEGGRNRLQERLGEAQRDEYDLGDTSEWEHLIIRVRTELPDPVDQEMVRMMMSGERRTSEYARALKIEDRTKLERERLVKQNKDRLKKRLERLGVKLSG